MCVVQFGPMPLSAHRNSGDCGVASVLAEVFHFLCAQEFILVLAAAYFTKMGMVLVSLSSR